MQKTPFNEIHEVLSDQIPRKILDRLPMKWEKVGDVCILRLDEDLSSYARKIGKGYAEVLQCKSVLVDCGGIVGDFRKPQVNLIYGNENTETIHKENGIRYLLDPSKVMFSSGNMDERKRMSTISDEGEVVVDMFAGIGYFSVPMAVYSKPKRIVSCEINPVAYEYLCRNIQMNDVVDIIEPLCGDSLLIAPENIANRVLMGYVGDTHRFFQKAIHCLHDLRGLIHFHDTFPDDEVPEKPMETLRSISSSLDRSVELLRVVRVKSYAPGIGHYVFDIRVE